MYFNKIKPKTNTPPPRGDFLLDVVDKI